MIELVCGVAFIAYFLKFGISEMFLLHAAFAAFVVIIAAIQWQQGWIAATIYSYAIAMIFLARTLVEHSIYPTVQSGFLMLMLALLVHKCTGSRHTKPFETPWIWWWVMLGALMPLDTWKFLLPGLVASLLIPKEWRVVAYASAALAVPVLL